MTALRSVLLVGALAAGVASCIAYEPTIKPMAMPWGQRVDVICVGGKTMAIDFLPSPRAARVSFDGTAVTLSQVEAASDAKFTDGRYTLYINDNRVALEETGILVRGPCQPR
ncbi:MAG TPA: MliC family protein [Burkholderiales bacterium]|nr:MliC family protein [Burkholderiales bacterium]